MLTFINQSCIFLAINDVLRPTKGVDKMDVLNKMIKIRKAQGLYASELSQMMGYDRTYLNKIEKKEKPLTPEAFNRFKKALHVPLLPLTDEEEAEFKQGLYAWKDDISFKDLDKAKEIQPKLARCAELTLSRDLQIMYDIFSAIFYRTVGKKEALETVLTKLEGQANGFTDEQSYWYNRQVGIRELYAQRYKTALDAFLKVETKGNILGFNNDALYYNIAHCLTDMGYTLKAMDYLQLAQDKALETNNNKNNVYIRYFLAINYRNLGKYTESLKILEGCLRDEREKSSASITIGLIYRHIALAYRDMGNYIKAIKNIGESFKYINNEHGAFIDNLYHEASILITSGKVDEGIVCLNKGLHMVEEGTIKHTMLNYLKHSINLNDPSSMQYTINEAIPKLKYYHMNIALLECYEKIFKHLEKSKKIKAFQYCKLAYELKNKLIKGDVT
jgi:tetratricopeptide (TPR) repeat protein